MEVACEIECPHCGETFAVMVDTTERDAEFVSDCEVCCRPIRFVARCEPGKVLALEYEADR